MAELRQELNALMRRIENVKLGSVSAKTLRNRRRRAKKKNKRGGFPVSGVIAPQIQNPAVGNFGGGGGKRKRRKGGGSAQPMGSIRVSREEYLGDIDTTANQAGKAGVYPLNPYVFTWLSTLAKAFDRHSWHSCRVFYKPAVGTNMNGILAYGMDWNYSGGGDKTKVLACTPVVDAPVWQATEMVLPSQKLMSRKEYLNSATLGVDSSPGQVVWYATHRDTSVITLGELWVCYDLTLFGPTA